MKRLAEPEPSDPLGTNGAEAIRDEKRAGAKMRSEHRPPPGTGAGTAAKRPKPRKKARKAPKRAISHDKCPETALSMPDARISALNAPHERTAEGYAETLFVLFSKTPFSHEIRIVF